MKWPRLRPRDRSKKFAWYPVRARSATTKQYIGGPDVWIWLQWVDVCWNQYGNSKWYEEQS